MALTDLASQELEFGMGHVVSLSDIAARQKISISFLEQLFAKLRRAGLVESIRGARGGYKLAVNAERLTLDKIILAIEEPIKAHGCTPETKLSCTGKSGQCLTHNLWGALESHIENFFAFVTIDDVVKGRLPSGQIDSEASLELAQ